MLSKLFNFDFRSLSYKHIGYFIPICMLAFGFYDAFLDTGKRFVTISEKLVQDSSQYFSSAFIEHTALGYFFKGVAIFLGIYITLFSYFSLKKSIKNHGKVKFLSVLIPHFLTNILSIAFTLVLLYTLGIIGYLITGELITDGNFLKGIEDKIVDFYTNKIPTLVNTPYILAIFLTIIFTDLPNYFLHWLTHKSRFLWYTVHRPHHTAEIMHPMGTGPVYILGILISIPRFLITLAVSKFIYYEPLLIELLIFYFFYALTEKFNHTSPFYNFAFNNKIVRFLSAFYGNGVYHYLHHSAKEGEETVNISGFFFNFWDRIFGTYVQPRKEKPAVGLTNQPDIILNPIAIYFSGVFTIFYELKNNSTKNWTKILFGSVYYVPPKTKDYLIIKYDKPPVT